MAKASRGPLTTPVAGQGAGRHSPPARRLLKIQRVIDDALVELERPMRPQCRLTCDISAKYFHHRLPEVKIWHQFLVN
jgi:hypothetical protein